MGIITEIGEKSKLEPKKEETDLYLEKIYEEKLRNMVYASNKIYEV